MNLIERWRGMSPSKSELGMQVALMVLLLDLLGLLVVSLFMPVPLIPPTIMVPVAIAIAVVALAAFCAFGLARMGDIAIVPSLFVLVLVIAGVVTSQNNMGPARLAGHLETYADMDLQRAPISLSLVTNSGRVVGVIGTSGTGFAELRVKDGLAIPISGGRIDLGPQVRLEISHVTGKVDFVENGASAGIIGRVMPTPLDERLQLVTGVQRNGSATEFLARRPLFSMLPKPAL